MNSFNTHPLVSHSDNQSLTISKIATQKETQQTPLEKQPEMTQLFHETISGNPLTLPPTPQSEAAIKAAPHIEATPQPIGHSGEIAQQVGQQAGQLFPPAGKAVEQEKPEQSPPPPVLSHVEGSYFLKDLCEDIKRASTSTNPVVEIATQKLTTELTDSLKKLAENELSLPVEENQVIEKSINTCLEAYFNPLVKNIKVKLEKQLEKSPDKHSAQKKIGSIIYSLQTSFEIAQGPLNLNVQEKLKNHPGLKELDGKRSTVSKEIIFYHKLCRQRGDASFP